MSVVQWWQSCFGSLVEAINYRSCTVTGMGASHILYRLKVKARYEVHTEDYTEIMYIHEDYLYMIHAGYSIVWLTD